MRLALRLPNGLWVVGGADCSITVSDGEPKTNDVSRDDAGRSRVRWGYRVQA